MKTETECLYKAIAALLHAYRNVPVSTSFMLKAKSDAERLLRKPVA